MRRETKFFSSIRLLLLTVEYEPLPISLINLKSFTDFLGICDAAEFAAIAIISLIK
jgi:hypothetical protein